MSRAAQRIASRIGWLLGLLLLGLAMLAAKARVR